MLERTLGLFFNWWLRQPSRCNPRFARFGCGFPCDYCQKCRGTDHAPPNIEREMNRDFMVWLITCPVAGVLVPQFVASLVSVRSLHPVLFYRCLCLLLTVLFEIVPPCQPGELLYNDRTKYDGATNGGLLQRAVRESLVKVVYLERQQQPCLGYVCGR